MEKQVDWKEEKFQEKLAQVLDAIGTEFYSILSRISEEKKLPSLDKEKEERIVSVRREYPTFQGDEGSRPDICMETNKGNILIFELKPDAEYNEKQLENHDKNMKSWMDDEENEGKTYMGTALILNKDTERAPLAFDNDDIYWLGWDSVYKALSELKINVLDSRLRDNIDRILSETPVNKLNVVLKDQLLRETEKSSLYDTLRTTVLVVEFMDQLRSQMNLGEILKRFGPIDGTESHKELTEKATVLFNSILRALKNEFAGEDFCAKIENWRSNVADYTDLIRLRLKDWRGSIDIDFNALISQAEDHILVRLYMQSGPKYSMLKPLVRLYEENLQKFENIVSDFKEKGVDWYCKFGSSPPISVEKGNMPAIREREFLPIYCEKEIAVYQRQRDEIYSEIAETVPTLANLYLLLLEQ